MRAIATALVLIIGAAIVLWYGNTLNSWVLGGLIGGLAALLLSIPISLALFAYLARHQSERRVEEEELAHPSEEFDEDYYEERSYIQPSRMVENSYERRTPPSRLAREVWEEEEQRLRAFYDERRAMPQQPASGRRSRRPSAEPLYREPLRESEPAPKPITRKISPAGQSRSHLQSAALRAARKEAAQQFDDIDEEPAREVRRPPSRDFDRVLPERENSSRRPAREQMSNVYPRSRRFQRERFAQSQHTQMPETDYLREDFLQTDQIDFPPRAHERSQDCDTMTDNLQRPIVRRAPYLYDDDPLRQELSYYAEEPITRRSSRLDGLHPRERRDGR